MGQFQLFAQPAWVNLLVFIPLGLFIGWRTKGLEISGRQLLFATLFALAFGFVEAAVGGLSACGHRSIAGLRRKSVRSAAPRERKRRCPPMAPTCPIE